MLLVFPQPREAGLGKNKGDHLDFDLKQQGWFALGDGIDIGKMVPEMDDPLLVYLTI